LFGECALDCRRTPRQSRFVAGGREHAWPRGGNGLAAHTLAEPLGQGGGVGIDRGAAHFGGAAQVGVGEGPAARGAGVARRAFP